MTHQVHGVYVMHPASAIMPKEMPHDVNIPVRLFDNRHDAEVHAAQMAAIKSIRATEQPVGINNVRCLVHGVAMHYTLSLADAEFEQFQKEKELHPVFMSINDARVGLISRMSVHFYEDALHYAGDFHPMEMSEEMAKRWYDFRHLERALKNTDPQFLETIDFTNENTRESLRMVYGTNGLLNQEYFTSHPHEDLLRSMERAVTSGEFGVGYALRIKDMEEQYQSIYRAKKEEGASEQVAIASAGMMACQVINMQAIHLCDNHTIQHFVEPTMAACQDMIDTAKDTIEALTGEELDIFE